MTRRNLVGAWGGWAVVVLLLVAAVPARADVVLDWNDVLLEAIRVDRTVPPRASRAMAIVQVSVYDSVVGILGGYSPSHVAGTAPAGASPEAAVVAAAHRALVALFPAQKATFDARRASSLAGIPDGPAEQAGIAWGEQVAGEILALRAGDGFDAAPIYEVPQGAGWWAPTPPALGTALLPGWGLVTPWSMTSGSQFRQGPQPAPNSSEYIRAFNEVKRVGRAGSASRTPDQTQIAFFWEDGPGTYTPPGHWHEIAQNISRARGLSLLENARLFGLLGIAMADAAIVSWDHKFAYHHWRPITGIRRAGEDGNPATTADPAWESLIPTPPFPSYTSGHSTFSGAASRVLALFFGTDAVAFTDDADPARWPEQLTGVSRSFTSLSQAAEEAGQSRVYGGIHWQYDNQVGLASGRELGEYVFFSQLGVRAAAGVCAPSETAACLAGGRFRVEAQFTTPQGATGIARTVVDTADSARFYFFEPDNTELVIKVLDGCAINDRFWVFASGLTNVEVILKVTDTETGRTRSYYNRQGQAFQPVQDTGAFTCG